MNVLIAPAVFCFLFTQFSCFVKLLFSLSVFSLNFSPISSGAFLWLCSKLWIKNMLDKTLADVEHSRQSSLTISFISKNFYRLTLLIGKFPALV